MNVPEIQEVKRHLDDMKDSGLIKEWELPYENILTRLTAAIFFFTPIEDSKLDEIWKELEKHPMLTFRLNEEKKLSPLVWRVEFNKGFEL
jgi:hypothetical protein